MKLILALVLTLNVFAQKGLTVVAVGEAEVVKEKIIVEKVFSDNGLTIKEVESADKLLDVVRNDFRFYNNYFHVLPKKLGQGDFNSVSYDAFIQREINYIIRAKLSKLGANLSLDVKVHSAVEKKLIAESVYTIGKNPRAIAHSISDMAYKKIVGKEPIFKHQIIFVSDANRKSGTKELYMMDFDGANIKQLTFHRGIVISPAVSPDGQSVLYSLIDEKKKKRNRNINLRLLDLKTKKSKLISKKRGINSGAVFTADGKSIILTLSHQGNAELYRMNLATKKLARLTKHGAPDVDPSITADGSLMTFLSARPGKPMIYTMNPASTENQVKRISYVGKFNATPRFSPNGKEIVFSSWMDNRFDLFKINSDGSGLGRLTKDFGSNEDPDYSKDGQFIIFTSQRVLSRSKAIQNVYIMDTEGKIIGSLTENFGKCISPRWFKSLKI
jgi:TolB protein